MIKSWDGPKCKCSVCALYTWPDLLFTSFYMNVCTYTYVCEYMYVCIYMYIVYHTLRHFSMIYVFHRYFQIILLSAFMQIAIDDYYCHFNHWNELSNHRPRLLSCYKHDVSLCFLKSRIVAASANVLYYYLQTTINKVYLILSYGRKRKIIVIAKTKIWKSH